jgi:LuxR family maltose regulon positive regulatory protein
MRALERIPQEDHEARATGIALLALAHWGRGELEQAHDTFSSALDEMRISGHDLDAVRGMFVLGDIRYAQGRLRDAADSYRRGLAVVSESPRFSTAEIDELHLGLSELHREWNDLASATSHLDAIRKRETTTVHKGNLQRWCVALARVREAEGDLDGALELLGDAENHERRDPLPRTRPIAAMKARIHIARGNIEGAVAWERSSGVTVNDTPSYLREFELLTLARLRMAQPKPMPDVAILFLERLQTAARTGGRTGSVIEVLVMTSLAQHAVGNVRGALDALAEALMLAEPEGFLRVFLDEGSRMRELLRMATTRGLAGAYTRRVLAAFEAPPPRVEPPVVSTGVTSPNHALTTRELEILRLIAAGLRNAEIAVHLQISPATVKRHIANTYGKLGVEHRTEALARAAEMKIL